MALDVFQIGSLKTTSMANREIFTITASAYNIGTGQTAYFQRINGTTYTVPTGYVLRILGIRYVATYQTGNYGPFTFYTSTGTAFGNIPTGIWPNSSPPAEDSYPVYISVAAGQSLYIQNNHTANASVGVRLLCMLEPV